MEYRKKLRMNMDLRPKRSAILANSRRKEPLANLEIMSVPWAELHTELWRETYDDDADIHVISGVVILRSRPTKEEITVTLPVVMELIPIAMVAVRTKRTSCRVDLKHSGRRLYLDVSGSSVEDVRISASFSRN
jgi:hypothetical protein